MHEWSLFSFFFDYFISLFYPIFCGVTLPLFSPFVFLRICIVLLRADQAKCPGYAVLLSPIPGAILCQTVDSHFIQTLLCVRHWQVSFRLHTNSPYESCPSTSWTCLSVLHLYWSQSLSPTVHKRMCYFVFPSFTYLTAAVLSYVVFPFTLLPSALTPAEQSASATRWSVWLSWGCFHYTWRYRARQGQMKLFHWFLTFAIDITSTRS